MASTAGKGPASNSRPSSCNACKRARCAGRAAMRLSRLSAVSCPMIAYHTIESPSVVFFFLVDILRQPCALSQNKYQHQSGEAEQLETHPAIGGVIERHIQIEKSEYRKKQAPA